MKIVSFTVFVYIKSTRNSEAHLDWKNEWVEPTRWRPALAYGRNQKEVPENPSIGLCEEWKEEVT